MVAAPILAARSARVNEPRRTPAPASWQNADSDPSRPGLPTPE
jgi:hypothetical protein